jgi:hypothetical protein
VAAVAAVAVQVLAQLHGMELLFRAEVQLVRPESAVELAATPMAVEAVAAVAVGLVEPQERLRVLPEANVPVLVDLPVQILFQTQLQL